MSGMRIDDVMVANAGFVEEPLIVAGRGNGRVHQRNAGNDLALAFARIANPDHPRLAEAIADNPAIAAGGYVPAGKPPRLQDIDAAVDRIAFRDAAQIDAHAFLGKLHRLILSVENHMPIVDCWQRLGNLRLVRPDVLWKIV